MRNEWYTTPRSMRGVTLIELLLASSILAIISLAVAFTFATGMKVYEASLSGDLSKRDALVAFEKIERDVRNSFAFTGLEFSGKDSAVHFAGIVKDRNASGTAPDVPGLISYYVDSDGACLVKEEKTYPEALAKGIGTSPQKTVLCPATDVSYKYYDFDRKSKTYFWKDSWTKTLDESGGKTAAPLGIHMKLVYKDSDGINKTLERTIFLPVQVSAQRAYMHQKAESRAADAVI